MAYCGPRGIPLSEFLRWHPDDQAAALAWQADENSRCPGCGTAEWEWEQDPLFASAATRICRGCNLRGHEMKSMGKAAEHVQGLYVTLVPRTVAEAARAT